MNYTDLFVILVSIIFIQRGWTLGILRSSLGPLTFIVGTFLGYFYYLVTKNIFISVCIGIFAPIILGILASTVFFILTRVSGAEPKSSTLSRAIAAFLNFLWGQMWFVSTLILILMVPDNILKMTSIRRDIERSVTYKMTSPYVARLLVKDQKNHPTSLSLMSFQDPKNAEKLQALPEFQAITNDKAIQDILNDPEIVEIINKKEMGKLMTNPKILKLASDPELMKKFMALYPKLLKTQNTQ